MKFDKERKAEVMEIYSKLRTGEMSEEEGNRLLVSYSDQLLEEVKATMQEGWKAKVQVVDQVSLNRWQAMTPQVKAVVATAPLVGAYVMFAACTHILAFDPQWAPPEWAPWLGNPALARFVLGGLGIICGLLTARLLAAGTLLSSLWLGAVGYLFNLWAVPLLLAGAVFLVFALQMVLKSDRRLSWAVGIGLGLAGLGGGLLVNVFAGMSAPAELPDAVQEVTSRHLGNSWIAIGAVIAVAGIITAVVGIKKSKE